MVIKDSNSERLIIDAAKQLFFKEGKFKATTQDIADAAGVNRTLVNYYFRSRDILFHKIFCDARADMDKRFQTLMSDDLSFREKVELFIDVFMEQAVTYPYIDAYAVSCWNDVGNGESQLFTEEENKEKYKRIQNFLKEIEQEIQAGNIVGPKPVDFFISLISLISYPSIAKPVLKKLFKLTDDNYKKMLLNRKQVILNLVFK